MDVAKTRESCSLLKYFPKAGQEEEDVTKAELLFTGFILEHNLPIAAADHAGPLFKKMFPDSKIASKYSCARTKTTAILGELSEQTSNSIAEKARSGPFSLATDGSNDGGSAQLYPVLISVFNETTGQVEEGLLSLAACENDSTGENIFLLLDKELKERKIPWENCVAFCADNASVMLGKHKGVASFIHKQNTDCYVVGCPCHMIHNTAKKAAKALPIALDELLVDIYYYLEKSSKRIRGVKHLQELCGKPTRKILKHAPTRWLSMGYCLERLLEQWDPLKLFFQGEIRRKLSKKAKIVQSKPVKKSVTATSQAKMAKQDPKLTVASGSSTATGSAKAPRTASKIVHQPTLTAGTSVPVPAKPPNTASRAKQKTLLTCSPTDRVTSHEKAHTGLTASKTVHKPTLNACKVKVTDPEKTSISSQTVQKPTVTAGIVTGSEKSPHIASKLVQRSTKSAGNSIVPAKNVSIKKTSVTKTGKLDVASSKPSTHPVQSLKRKHTTNTCTSTLKTQELRETRINRLLVSPQTKLYCFFLHYANGIFDKGNLLLQREEPCIHLLHRELSSMLKDIMLRFVKPAVVVSEPLTTVKFMDRKNQKSDEDLMTGKAAKDYLKASCQSTEETDQPSLSQTDISAFYSAVRSFYEKACDYILKTWPLHDELLQHAEVLDLHMRQHKKFASLKYFVERFPCLLREDKMDQLEIEFAHYQVDPLCTVDTSLRIDQQWDEIAKVHDPSTGGMKFTTLVNVMKGILVIPHSNASCERAFSLVRKNKTDFRPNLGVKTLEAILVEKLSQKKCCYQREYPSSTLRKAKQATQKALTTSSQ